MEQQLIEQLPVWIILIALYLDYRRTRSTQVTTLSNSLNAALTSLDTMRTRQDETERALHEERSNYTNYRIAAENEIDGLREEIASLVREVSELRSRIAQLEADLAHSHAERDALITKINHLTAQLDGE